MLKRQRIILSLIQKSGGKISRLEIMKLAFLLSREGESRILENFYQFLPYKFGPYSFNMIHELDSLKSNGFIKDISKQELSITQIAKSELENLEGSVVSDINRINRIYGKLSVSKLIDAVYSNYPWYTVLSDNINKRTQQLPKAVKKVYTAGYEGLQIDGFLDLILKAGIRRIIDIRKNPISRVYGFHGKTLSRLSRNLGIEYNHFPTLGIETNLRSNLVKESDYIHLFNNYKADVLSNKMDEIESVVKLMNDLPSVLVCQEANNNQCHRSVLAGIVSSYLNKDFIELRKRYE